MYVYKIRVGFIQHNFSNTLNTIPFVKNIFFIRIFLYVSQALKTAKNLKISKE